MIAPMAPIATNVEPRMIHRILAMGLDVSLAVCKSLSVLFNGL